MPSIVYKDLSAEEAVDKATCGICHRQVSRYTCPSCNIPYCSLTCFRSNEHAQCSEVFYKRELESEIRTQPSASMEERRRMLEMLKKFEEENGTEGAGEGEDEGDGDGDDLAERFGSIDIESASASDIWNALTPEERKNFMNKFRDPTSTSAQEFLRSAGLEAEIVLPWWLAPYVPLDEDARTSRTQKYGERPKIETIPDALLSRTPGPHTGPPLLYNICAVFIAYAYVTRHLGISPLSALRDEDERSSARQLIRKLMPFLGDKRSTTLFVSMDDVVMDMWPKLVSSQGVDRTSFVALLRDAARLLTPRRVTEVESSNRPNGSDLEWSPQRDALLALSDLVTLFTTHSGVIKETPASHKLRFYAAQIASLPAKLLAAFSAEVSARAQSVELEGQQFVQASEDPSSEARNSAPDAGGRTKTRAVIEEL